MRSEKLHRATPLPAGTNLPAEMRDVLKRYGLALVLAGLALLLRGSLPLLQGTAIYQLPIAAVVLSAWYGGRGPGLLASLICATGILYWFVPPENSFELSPEYALAFFIFLALSLLLCEFSAGRRRALHALRAGEERFRTFLDVAADALMVHAEDGTVVDVNRQACESLGYTRQELIGMKPAAFDAGLDKTGLRRVVEQVEAGDVVTFETQWRRKDGTVFPVEVRGRQFRHEARWLGISISRDITERKRAEVELRVRQEMLDVAQMAARAAAFNMYMGARESENRWSPELEAMYGLEPGTLGNMYLEPTLDKTYVGWAKLVHPDDWPTVKLATERAHESGDVDAEYRVIHRDGTVHWLRAKGRMFFDAEGRPERAVGFLLDVTDRRNAEEELRASEARFRTFVDRATDAFYLLDEQQLVVDVNRQACESLGLSREELIGMHPREFDLGLDEASIGRLAQRVGAGQMITFETRHRRKDGSEFPVEIRTGSFKQGGKVFHLALARDISERKFAEETLREKDHALQLARTELARVSRLTTLGELTTSIAHEVSQPLGAMVASAGAGARWLGADPPALTEARAALDNIVADGKRAREVIARIRGLTRRQAPRKERLDINHEIAEVHALTEHELRSHAIVLRTDLYRALPRIVGDRVQLQQVLLNLIVNAIEAMSTVHDRPRELTIVSRQDDSDAVLVEVRDSGTGLDPQRAEHVFEAFYTTKEEGIGIGLSISRSIVEAHGGRLWAAPNEPHGAVFRFSLPVTQETMS